MIWKVARISINKAMFFLLSEVNLTFKFCKSFLTIKLAVHWTRTKDDETQYLTLMNKEYLIWFSSLALFRAIKHQRISKDLMKYFHTWKSSLLTLIKQGKLNREKEF